MAYTNLFRKLANAWGIKTEANTEYGALEAIAENPPFGTKTEMVELVPEQSVTAGFTDDGISAYGYEFEFYLNPNAKYKVTINGTTYGTMSVVDGRIGNAGIFDGDSTGIPFVAEEGIILWRKELGETINLCIIEELEVVKPIDNKFLGGSRTITFYYDEYEQTSGCSATFEDVMKSLWDTDDLLNYPSVKLVHRAIGGTFIYPMHYINEGSKGVQIFFGYANVMEEYKALLNAGTGEIEITKVD